MGRAMSMMTGYFGRNDLTEQLTWRDAAGRAFYRTGDLGRMDEDGFLQVVGRTQDVINSGGQNIYPTDLEQVLTSHEAVADAAVIGVPDPQWGETPALWSCWSPGQSVVRLSCRIGPTLAWGRCNIFRASRCEDHCRATPSASWSGRGSNRIHSIAAFPSFLVCDHNLNFVRVFQQERVRTHQETY